MLDSYEKKVNRFISDSIDPRWNYYYRFGYRCEGPLLYGFSKWLHKNIERRKFDKILFMARDGYLMMKSYNILYGDTNLKGDYLYISRRSVHVPLLWRHPNLKDYLSINGMNKRWSYTTVSNRLGLDPDEALTAWKSCGLKTDSYFKIEELVENSLIIEFFERTKEKAIENSRREYELMLKYFNSINFTGNIAIVDSGGGATTQKILQKYCDDGIIDAHITGYYIWLFDNTDFGCKCFSFASDSRAVGGETVPIEFPLTSYEGTTVKYRQLGDAIVPVFEEYEFKNEPAIQEAIEQIQAGCLDFVKYMRDSTEDLIFSQRVSYHNIKMVTRYPRRIDVDKLGDFRFHSDREDTYLSRPKRLTHYIFHPKELSSEFKIIRWKNGFLRRLLYIPLPYYYAIVFTKKCISLIKNITEKNEKNENPFCSIQ